MIHYQHLSFIYFELGTLSIETFMSTDIGTRVRNSFPFLIIFGVCMIIFAIIAVSVQFTAVKDNENERSDHYKNLENWVSEDCHFENYVETTYPCARKHSCLCWECNSFPTCSSMFTSLTAGECCDGPRCCQERTRYCTRTSCSGTSSSRRCRTTRYPCGKSCVKRVSNERCAISVGTCHTIRSTVIFGDNDQYSKEFTLTCGFDDYECLDRAENNWGNGTEATCWYDERDPVGTVRLDGFPPVPDKNKDANNSVIIFSVLAGICFIIFAFSFGNVFWPMIKNVLVGGSDGI